MLGQDDEAGVAGKSRPLPWQLALMRWVDLLSNLGLDKIDMSAIDIDYLKFIEGYYLPTLIWIAE